MYSFDEKKHLHTFDGKPLTGVTTVLSVISKGDGLIQWSANEAVKWLKENPTDYDGAKFAWKTCRDSAGDKGTDLHAEVERVIKDAIQNNGGYVKKDDKVKQFTDWAITNKIKFLESEKNVWSKELWIGGIVDFVFERDGEVYVGDLKTSKTIYATYFWQTSAYQYCLQEMGLYPKIKGFCIVRLGKDGSFEVGENYAYDDNIEGFKSALTIYRKLNLISTPRYATSNKKVLKI